MPKYRYGFVSNSSTASFVCQYCGETFSGDDCGSLADIGVMYCREGHTVCGDCVIPGENIGFYADVVKTLSRSAYEPYAMIQLQLGYPIDNAHGTYIHYVHKLVDKMLQDEWTTAPLEFGGILVELLVGEYVNAKCDPNIVHAINCVDKTMCLCCINGVNYDFGSYFESSGFCGESHASGGVPEYGGDERDDVATMVRA